MEVLSTAFEYNQAIPQKYTCDGGDISPPLTIKDVPKDTKSLVIIVDDPDAPMGTFDHWIAWNLPPDLKELKEGSSFPLQGKNDFGENRYRGPCPPSGNPHRYFFKIYALDMELSLSEGAAKEEVEKAMDNHILDHAELMGTYQR